ncbi:hypothetical protein A2662_04615 [Candidatus Giovannonibacteria bacterium RIFCSPHIGHO2_01_FULL_45_33]|uniref:Uncharacterized protein n=1 Tax=Candidatus Giovannonibacteria bacterium RIFCSPLOWO2_01_FULL_45_34 TaxID=1798351 RepID=A0A1F5WZL3_9BACT|nr:MAG: hypothetical protein A2662_04615 [Candidatus Giovannonibacteria bacterium RIFCSPHIGHO2_01_FULL_45_33]OGF81059.1 MAG: hypothetical protein A2930_03330 [Candidatus Giovannonibacteria bacterium RIFCSPLOWO2_01_FULL_45_34]
MIFVIGLPILVIVFSWADWFRYASDFLDYFFLSLSGLSLVGVVATIGAGLAFLVGCILPKKWQNSGTAKLIAMRDINGIKGSFVLGTGSIESKQYYFFYKEQGGGFVPGKVEVSDNVVIYEEGREDGALKSFSREFSNPIFWFFGVVSSERYEFFIPKGSIRTGFVL